VTDIGLGPIAWDGHADFATVALPSVDGAPYSGQCLTDERLHSAWQVYGQFVANPGDTATAATPVVKLSPPAMAEAVDGAAKPWPLSCTYSTCLFDDDEGRRLEQYFGAVLTAPERAREVDPHERRHNYLAMLPARPLIELFPLAGLGAACSIGDPALFDRALALGADVMRPIMEGWGGKYITYPRYPLVMAIEAGHGWAVDRLLDAGADPAVLDHADYRVQERLRLQPAIAEAIMARGYPPTSNADGLTGEKDWENRRNLPDDAFIAATISEGGFTPEDYPEAALRAEAQGEVEVEIWVSDTRPAGCRVVKSSGNAALDARTCDVFLQRFWFSPAQGRLLPRPVRMRQTVRWRLPFD
jgi:TonB family protein